MAPFDPEEVVALLSCFVFQEKTDSEPKIPPKLEEGRDAILAIADRVARTQDYHKVPGQDFRQLKFGLMEVVYEWAKGMVRLPRLGESLTDSGRVAAAAIRADH